MDQQTNRNNLEAGWDALAKGEFDQLASYYTEGYAFHHTRAERRSGWQSGFQGSAG
jgi:hypothetical protein